MNNYKDNDLLTSATNGTIMVFGCLLIYLGIFGILFLIACIFNINETWTQETSNIVGYICGGLTLIIGTYIMITIFRKE